MLFINNYEKFEENVIKNVRDLKNIVSFNKNSNNIIDEESVDYYQNAGKDEIKEEFSKILKRPDIQMEEKKNLIKNWFLNSFNINKKSQEFDN